MEEDHLIDIVDKNDKIVGCATKEEKFEEELISRNVVAFIKNKKGELIIVKRSPRKRSWPLSPARSPASAAPWWARRRTAPWARATCRFLQRGRPRWPSTTWWWEWRCPCGEGGRDRERGLGRLRTSPPAGFRPALGTGPGAGPVPPRERNP